MADNFASFYSGNMSPPIRLPDGTYIPAPMTSPPMSVQDMYQGIYPPAPASGGLTSRPIRTVQINPSTGMPYTPTVNARAAYAGGIGAGASGSLTFPPMAAPNQPAGSIRMAKDQSRLPETSRDADLLSGYTPLAPNAATSAIAAATRPPMTATGGARGTLGAMGRASGSLAFPPRNSDGIIDLSALNMSDQGAQGIADSEGKPIRAANGKVYYPGGKAPQGAPRASVTQTQQKPTGLFGGLFGGGGGQGILSGLFGGNGGGRAALESGWNVARSSIGNSPDQGKAMVVAPGTASGSVLSGMGFSDGALVPAATIRGLESRGYFK